MKSHFWYTKNQRNGILFLIASIIGFQIFFYFINFEESVLIAVDQSKIESYQIQLDSLRKISKDKGFKLYPFNPNYISDYKGYQLGMKTKEIDRLLAHRKNSLFVNSAKEFQMITKVSDSLLKKIAPHFKFPDWVKKKNQQNKKKRIFNSQPKVNRIDISSTNINEATLKDLLSVNGVNEYLANRIIKYRSKLQGFSLPEQLFEVWDLDKEIGIKILETFSIVRKPIIVKTNINTASFKEILSNPYIDYNLCLKIFDYKDEVAELQSISEIKNIEGFPLEKYTRIVLYLHAE